MVERETLAYAIIAALILTTLVGWAATRRKRKIARLRRRGIKTYGH